MRTRFNKVISPHAVIDPRAVIGEGVSIGPFSVIGPDVTIGDNTQIESHVVLKGPTVIGRNNHIYQFATVGEDTPDLKYNGEPTRLVIGDNNVIREGVTIHRGTVQDNGETVIGNHNLLMAYVHIGHDSIVGNHCILVNNASLAGHVIVDDYAILSGYVLVHQYCTIGSHAFVGMGSACGKDIPAYCMITGAPAEAKGLNLEGLKRRGFTSDDLRAVKNAYKMVYRKGLTLDDAMAELEKDLDANPNVKTFYDSIKRSTRGIVR